MKPLVAVTDKWRILRRDHGCSLVQSSLVDGRDGSLHHQVETKLDLPNTKVSDNHSTSAKLRSFSDKVLQLLKIRINPKVKVNRMEPLLPGSSTC